MGLDDDTLYASEYYYRILLGHPIVYQVIQLIVIGIVIRQDTAMFLI